MRRHRAALITIAAALSLDAVAGLVFAAAEHISAGLGLYWAVTTATTCGYGDISPRSGAGHVIAVITMLTIIPLFGASFSLFTSGLTGGHVAASERRVRAHIERLAGGGVEEGGEGEAG